MKSKTSGKIFGKQPIQMLAAAAISIYDHRHICGINHVPPVVLYYTNSFEVDAIIILFL